MGSCGEESHVAGWGDCGLERRGWFAGRYTGAGNSFWTLGVAICGDAGSVYDHRQESDWGGGGAGRKAAIEWARAGADGGLQFISECQDVFGQRGRARAADFDYSAGDLQDKYGIVYGGRGGGVGDSRQPGGGGDDQGWQRRWQTGRDCGQGDCRAQHVPGRRGVYQRLAGTRDCRNR